jgi:glutathione S-transferase
LWVAEQASRLKALYNWPEGTYEGAIFRVKENIGCVWQWAETGGYIANSEFTLADIYFYHLITWVKQHNIEYSSGVSGYLGLLQGRLNDFKVRFQNYICSHLICAYRKQHRVRKWLLVSCIDN